MSLHAQRHASVRVQADAHSLHRAHRIRSTAKRRTCLRSSSWLNKAVQGRSAASDNGAATSAQQDPVKQLTSTALGDLADYEHPVSVEEFRRQGYEMVDIMCDYMRDIETLPVRPKVQPGFLRPQLPDAAPEQPDSFAQVVADVKAKLMPGVVHWQHPRFMAYFSANISPPAMLADMWSSVLNMIGFSWAAGPVSTELEIVMMDWLAQLCGLPSQFLFSTHVPTEPSTPQQAPAAMQNGTATTVVVGAPPASPTSSAAPLSVASASSTTSSSSVAAAAAPAAAPALTSSKSAANGTAAGVASTGTANGAVAVDRSPASSGGDRLSAASNVSSSSTASGTLPASVQSSTNAVQSGTPAVRSGTGGGVIQGTTSEAVVVALLAAIAKKMRGRPAADRLRLVCYSSDQAHSVFKKACMVAGLTHVRILPALEANDYALQSTALEASMQQDEQSGLLPCWVMATIGTTSSCAVDPVGQLAEVARRHTAWIHVDAAYAGSAAICPEQRHWFQGLDLTDSYSFNPHKWMLVNFDCCAMWVSDSAPLKEALSLTPVFLQGTGNALDFKDWGIPLGRKFRSLKLYFVLRMYGAEALRRYIRHHIALAQYFGEQVAADPRFEVAAPVRFGLVCFRLKGQPNAVNAALLAAINAQGGTFLIHTELSGRYTLRFAIGSIGTQLRHVTAAWVDIQSAADKVLGTGSVIPTTR